MQGALPHGIATEKDTEEYWNLGLFTDRACHVANRDVHCVRKSITFLNTVGSCGFAHNANYLSVRRHATSHLAVKALLVRSHLSGDAIRATTRPQFPGAFESSKVPQSCYEILQCIHLELKLACRCIAGREQEPRSRVILHQELVECRVLST